MKINKGVEWAAHACSLLEPLWPNKGLPLAALASFHELPESYMAKQMQALSRAGIVSGGRGRSGFYILARPPKEISLLDILLAVDGDGPMFSCSEIRQNGPCALDRSECNSSCIIAAQFAKAEKLYHESLAGVDLQSLNLNFTKGLSAEKFEKMTAWLEENQRSRS